MELRSPRLVRLCSCFLALGLLGVQVAGCDSNGQPTASDEAGGGPVASIPGFTHLKRNEQGHPEYRHEGTGIVFVKLPGGKFTMGATAKGKGDLLATVPVSFRSDVERSLKGEDPRHEVGLSPFLIAKHEVTQAQWKAAMGTAPSDFKGDELPVEKVSWEDCQEFCKETGLSLPTEAQWEYACRAGTDTSFGFGDEAEDLADHAWYYLNSGHEKLPAGTQWSGQKSLPGGEWGCRTRPVGTKKANGFGLHDMHGNVWEWCEDTFDFEYYSQVASRDGDVACTAGFGERVLRGGGWNAIAGFCRSAHRGNRRPTLGTDHVGFRPVMRLP